MPELLNGRESPPFLSVCVFSCVRLSTRERKRNPRWRFFLPFPLLLVENQRVLRKPRYGGLKKSRRPMIVEYIMCM